MATIPNLNATVTAEATYLFAMLPFHGVMIETTLRNELSNSTNIPQVASPLILLKSQYQLTIDQLVESIWNILIEDSRSQTTLIELSKSILQENTQHMATSTVPSTPTSCGSNPVNGIAVEPRKSTKAHPQPLPSKGLRVRSKQPVVRAADVVLQTTMQPGTVASRSQLRKGDQAGRKVPEPLHKQRRHRGAGKKPKRQPPDVSESRFLAIPGSLRSEISEYTKLAALQSCWKLVHSFPGSQDAETQIMPTGTRIVDLHNQIIVCEKLERGGEGFCIRAKVQRRFFMVQLMAEYLEAKKEKHRGTRDDDVEKTFQTQLFPRKGSVPASAS